VVEVVCDLALDLADFLLGGDRHDGYQDESCQWIAWIACECTLRLRFDCVEGTSWTVNSNPS
jgi:hypothetical protein